MCMRKLFLLFVFIITNSFVFSQKNYVTWSFSQKKISGDEYELILKAVAEPGWHLYSQIETPNGPLSTIFDFEKSKDYKLIGKTKEPKPNEVKDPMWDNQIVRSFEGTVIFKQRIKALTNKPFVVKGFIDGMACDEHQCQKFSPAPEFKFKIEDAEVATTNTVVTIEDTATATAKTETQTASETPEGVVTTPDTVSNKNLVTEVKQADPPKNNKSLWVIFLAGFLGGFAALLTPCVFPMIPMTVSFFTKQSKTKAKGIKNAFIYALSIIGIYVVLGLGVTLIFGADALNNLATNVWFNIFFFLLLVVFAISFLGAFEIVLPSRFVNKMDAKSEKGGLLGIFFMAFTLGLVSFYCSLSLPSHFWGHSKSFYQADL